jgi:hypothetical protein
MGTVSRRSFAAGNTFAVGARHFFSGSPVPLRMLLLSDGKSAQSEAQFDPLFRHRLELQNRFGLVTVHETLNPMSLPSPRQLKGNDIICLKFDYRTCPEIAMRVARHFAAAKPAGTVLIYCDGNDELTIQWPGLLPYFDLYWKKHAFRDVSLYRRRFRGSTNLTEHALGLASDDLDTAAGDAFKLPEEADLKKIFVGTSVGLDKKIFELEGFLTDEKLAHNFATRYHDVVLRADLPENWMGQLRRPAADALRNLQDQLNVLLPHGRVPVTQYAREMMTSKVCVSPFGYGEICWRDFEAIAYGCLLFKPNMQHVQSRPDIFQPFQTYIPVAWDFSDLNEKLLYYIRRPAECVGITARARKVLTDTFKPGWFTNVFGELLEAIGK